MTSKQAIMRVDTGRALVSRPPAYEHLRPNRGAEQPRMHSVADDRCCSTEAGEVTDAA